MKISATIQIRGGPTQVYILAGSVFQKLSLYTKVGPKPVWNTFSSVWSPTSASLAIIHHEGDVHTLNTTSAHKDSCVC